MSVLHVCSYFFDSEVHKNLIEKMYSLKKNILHDVIVPLRKKNISAVDRVDGLTVTPLNCLSKLTKFSLLAKVFFIYRNFKTESSYSNAISTTKIIHAHTLYADGFLAYKVAMDLKVPYVITVRVTDVYLSKKYYRHQKSKAKKILLKAQKVIFLNENHRSIMNSHFGLLLTNSTVIAHGLGSYWEKNLKISKNSKSIDEGLLNFLFVGRFNENKNIKRTIDAVFGLETDKKIMLTIVGGSYNDYVAVYGRLDEVNLASILFVEWTVESMTLKDIYERSDVLILVSHLETFGLVYLEAISQCTPVVYSYGQGIDGLFLEGEVGFGCNSRDTQSITMAIKSCLKQHPNGLDFTSTKINPVSKNSWSCVAKTVLSEGYGY